MKRYSLMYILISYILTHKTKNYLDLIQDGDKTVSETFFSIYKIIRQNLPI